MHWLIILILLYAAALMLARLLWTAQASKKGGTPSSGLTVLYHVLLWGAFAAYLALMGLLLWIGYTLYRDGQGADAAKLVITGLLLGVCIYILFLHPLFRHVFLSKRSRKNKSS